MAKNPLLARAELGKVKPLLFNQPTDSHVFGYELPKDPENAREVTGIWKSHSPSPGTEGLTKDGQPMQDFKKMNIEAARNGLTTAKEQPYFRATNTQHVKKFDSTQKPSKPLPSDRNAKHTYGMASAHRTADTVRQCGPEEPPMKYVLQGAFVDDWVKTNTFKSDQSAGQNQYVPPVPTRATIGHAIGAQKYLQPHHGGEEWKMTKFKAVPARVTQYMAGSTGPRGGQLMEQSYEAQPPAEAQYEEHPAPEEQTAYTEN